MFPSDTDNETKVTLETEMSPLAEDPPFHILLIGDWSGRENRSISSAPKYNPIEIDRDNFDEVIKRLGVGLNLDFQGSGSNVLSLSFNELEDFHPDQIFQRVPIFDNLRDIRKRLKNSDTFNEAARDVRSWLADNQNLDSSDIRQTEPAVEKQQNSQDDLLNHILNQSNDTDSSLTTQTADSKELSAFVKNIVKPYLIHTDLEEQSKLLMVVDEVISDIMRKVLHHPHFQALESSWRGAYLVVRRVETNAELKIYLMDVSKGEIVADLKSAADLTSSRIYRVFAQDGLNASNDKFWSVISGNYSFSLNVDDVATLIRIAKIADDCQTPFISHITPEMFGIKDFSETENSDKWKVSENSTEGKLWTTLRNIPESAYLGLSLPRFLVRLPYGEETEPTENFSFEEVSSNFGHEQYLWTNPIFACTLLLAQTFSKFGWNMSQNFFHDISNLPLHLFKTGNEGATKPCAEISMTESFCERLLEEGLIPLISFKDSDRIRIGRFQSIASPFSTLKGSWD